MEKRAESSDRRDIRRPSLRLNLSLLIIAIATLLFARHQRRRIDADFTRVFERSSAGPSELNQIAAELAESDFAKEALESELKSRLSYIASLKSLDYYLSIDTRRKILSLKSGNETVREAGVRIGAPAARKGAFTVMGKKVATASPAINNGPGRYVIILPDDQVILSPARDSPLKGPKPGSFMVPEADLQAIWDRITPATRVYIF